MPYSLPAPLSDPITDSITRWSACALRRAIDLREVSCVEVMNAYLDRIDTINPGYNAIVSQVGRDRVLAEARGRDEQLARGDHQGWMHGFPMAVKDLASTAGVRTTFGSRAFAGHIPKEDDLTVARMKRAGGIVIGKTNVPEFGLGSNTFNDVFGITRNAIDPSCTAGGSSGGAAVSLALRLQPVADGSDFMGSLRNPAAFNNVFGFRPSQGRVPGNLSGDQFVSQLSTDGPMARTVGDLAMLLSVQAGRDLQAPLSLAGDGSEFASSLKSDVKGVRIGWLGDLKGHLPMEPGILATCESALRRFETLGCEVDTATLGMPGEEIWRTWLTLRGWLTAGRLAACAADPRKLDTLKPEARWELEQGQRLSAADVFAASTARSRFFQRILGPFRRCDFLALPTSQVWPFEAETRWPKHIDGVEMDTYHRWMEVSIYATLAGLPVINVPAGFDARGRPMGLQLIGKPQADLSVLKLASAYEGTISDLLMRGTSGFGVSS